MIIKSDPQAVAPYLRDASNYSGGRASSVAIPESPDELPDFLRRNRELLTIAGAGTGLTASRIPKTGIAISLEKLNSIGEVREGRIEVGPAVTLADLQGHLLAQSSLFYPPNPTETWASIGGTLATNASGSRSYKFGVTRDHVRSATVILADGRCVRLDRGLKIDRPLVFDDGSAIAFPEVSYQSPTCKNAAGYFIRPGMDWLDLFIGSEGTLGIFTSVELQLKTRPFDFISGVLFLSSEDACWDLVEQLKGERECISPCSLEYFDGKSLDRLRHKFSRIPATARAALFFEQDVESAGQYDPLLEAWYAYLENKQDVLLDESWFATDSKQMREFHEFRHELPQIVNEENSRMGRMKLGTDMAVDDAYFLPMMRFYRETLESSAMDYVVFGHIGNNHLHVNLLPPKEKMEEACRVYLAMVDRILEWGGTVSAEHGIGKIKKTYLQRMVGDRAVEDFKKIKRALDPGWILGIGTLFD